MQLKHVLSSVSLSDKTLSQSNTPLIQQGAPLGGPKIKGRGRDRIPLCIGDGTWGRLTWPKRHMTVVGMGRESSFCVGFLRLALTTQRLLDAGAAGMAEVLVLEA